MALDDKERREVVQLLKKGGYRVPRELNQQLGSVKITNKDKKRMELFLTEHRLMVIAVGKVKGRERGFRIYTWDGYKKMKESKNGNGEERQSLGHPDGPISSVH